MDKIVERLTRFFMNGYGLGILDCNREEILLDDRLEIYAKNRAEETTQQIREAMWTRIEDEYPTDSEKLYVIDCRGIFQIGYINPETLSLNNRYTYEKILTNNITRWREI